MERKQTRIFMLLGWVLLSAVILWGFNSVQAQTIGKTIDKSNVQEYKDLLIPPMYRAVEKGEFLSLPTANLDFPYKHWDRFLAASEKNAGKFDVNEPGDLTDKSTGKSYPRYNIYGLPFPKIDPKDPRAGDKIIWNFNFERYRFMGARTWNRLMWVGKGGEERYVRGVESLLFLQGRPPGEQLRNPQNFLNLAMGVLTDPMSIKGTNTMSWEYFDARDIAQFAYVPAIRRIRRTSGVSRSDPFMGSDSWLDLNYLWAGKNSSMKWKLVGERTVLVPFTNTHKEVAEEAPDGTIRVKYPAIKWGFRVKGWKGAPWVPTNVTYVPRKVWVVEQWPKDPYYNWGLHINYVDKETYVIWLKEVYQKSGEFRTWASIPLHYEEAPSGNNTVGVLDGYQIIDERIPHAYVQDREPSLEYSNIFMPGSRIGADYFTTSNFLQLSK